MARTRRVMQDDLKNVDMICEILDARIPKSSRNPDLNDLCRGKRRMLVLNRCDQADPAATARWAAFYRGQGLRVLETDSQKGGFTSAFTAAARQTCADLLERQAAKGQSGKPIRIMIMGIPNVGKSSFINRLLGKKAAVAADKPGVTRGKQWFTLPGGFDFMDTPGMLWPKIESDEMGYLLAFTGTIRDNMQWACPDATDEQIWQALELAQAADFVRGKPKGLDEPVETAGRNFSGGQRQRLTIARALVPHPQVLILDDSSSALDFATDAALRKALKEQTHGMTVFIVSQRASAVQRADRILVLDDGNLVGSGTHANLLKTCDVYREICLSQLSREEVEKTL